MQMSKIWRKVSFVTRADCVNSACLLLFERYGSALSHAEGRDEESSANENSDGADSTAGASEAGNIDDDQKCVCYIQPVSPTRSLL